MQTKGLLSGTVLPCRTQQRHHLLPPAPAAKLPAGCLTHRLACSASAQQSARQRVVAQVASVRNEAGPSAASNDSDKRRRTSAQVPLEEVPLTSEVRADPTCV